MWNLTGNQWSCIRVGVMWRQGLMPVKTLAAEFCTYCSLSRVLEGRPVSMALQQSRRVEMKQWIRVSVTESESEGRSHAMFFRWWNADLVTFLM